MYATLQRMFPAIGTNLDERCHNAQQDRRVKAQKRAKKTKENLLCLIFIVHFEIFFFLLVSRLDIKRASRTKCADL